MRTFGQLEFDASKGKQRWVVSRLEPHVAIRFKQMFDRVPKQSTGPFYLPATGEMAADLSWFMERYPLDSSDVVCRRLKRDKRGYERLTAQMDEIFMPSYRPPAVMGMKEAYCPRAYQLQAVQWLRLRRWGLLGDDGGLGKTITTAAFFCAEPGSLPAVVVCEGHLQRQWKDRLEASTGLRVHVVNTAKPYSLPEADVYVFRYSQLAGWVDVYKRMQFVSVVYDEIQALRTGADTAKGGGAKVLSEHAKYRLGLSATPIYNYGREMWNVLQFIDERIWPSYGDFQREYVNSAGRIQDPKALGSYLREVGVLLRRHKADVGMELPKVSRVVEYIDYDVREVTRVEELAKALAIKASSGSFFERGEARRELDLLVRHATGMAKARAVALFVRLLVEAGESVLLAGWHRDVYDVWLKELADLNPVMHTGTESVPQKLKSVEAFLSGQSKVMIISLRSNAGLDGLQGVCSTVVVGELDWSPGVHDQLIWRIDRDGQPLPVTAFFLVADDGSDPPMMDLLGIKASESHQILDPMQEAVSHEGDTTNVQRLVERYLKKVGQQSAHAAQDAG